MDDDAVLVDRVRSGDESAFVELVRRYQARLVHLAAAIVGSRAVAEEVTQDTWLAVVRGVERFEGRASFKTWLFRILVNRARSAAGRERRAGRPEDDLTERFAEAGRWATPPVPWSEQVEDRVVAEGLATRIHDLLPLVPGAQREVVILRDVEGILPADVGCMLGISDVNQRVLLHRGRARLRRLLAAEMEGAR